ncbi:MAG: cob(I)yrinic acid a,c-diamide adenosyltransferase [Porphyromonadaceae bacterium]|nr:cob(I)yrinic acid a,c-diamide adenosyltransferase [Porphyromonadaceae bacterium]
MDKQGQIHIYTGNGKGKTTAAFGLAVRALCSGKRVFIGQFVKSMKYNETKIETLFDHVTIKQYGRGCFISKDPEKEDIDEAQKGWKDAVAALQNPDNDVVILDELTIAIYFRLLSVEDILKGLKSKEPHIEVVITGRYAPKELIDFADLVTEMVEVKHYYTKGILSRDGIDK